MATTFITTSFSTEEFKSFITECITHSLKEELKISPAIPEPNNIILTRQQTAKLLAISLPTLHDYTKRGLIKAFRLGCKVRYKVEDIQASLILIKTSKS